MSWRWLAALLGVCVATAGACGSSDENSDDPGDGAGGNSSSVGGDGGTSPGEAGQRGDGGSGAAASGGSTAAASATTQTSTGFVSTGTSTTSSATSSTSSGTTGSVATWTCSMSDYENGTCDCGCGVPDPDCASDDIDDCEVCSGVGSCNASACPGKIDPTDTTRCLEPPSEWSCTSSAYDDGSECHCGCGAPDPDCEDESADSCDVCRFDGSCAGGACPSSIDEDDNTRCDIPEGWTCSPYIYGDEVCHCGCGVVDMDCSSASVDACEVCWTGCTGQGCPGPIDAENNAICTGLPLSWRCSERFFNDGSICHCGCGAPDLDCGSNDIDECDRCNLEGSCSVQECPGTIDPDRIQVCEQPPPPAGWTCYAGDYANGNACDCGCGALDLDCVDDTIDSCDYCNACGSQYCPSKVDPDDITSCVPPPAGWQCDDGSYSDGYACHCGCGVLDPDCASLEASSCDWCLTGYGSCAENDDCRDVLPENNARCVEDAPTGWTCDPEVYQDGACDCGCGVRDLDCASGDSSVCEFCDAPGSCSDTSCSDLDEEDNAVCL